MKSKKLIELVTPDVFISKFKDWARDVKRISTIRLHPDGTLNTELTQGCRQSYNEAIDHALDFVQYLLGVE